MNYQSRKYISHIIIPIFTIVFSIFLTKNTNAASLVNFKAGNIISDYTMGNSNTMSREDIRNFLRNQVSCNDYDLKKENAGGYNWEWVDYRDPSGVNYNYRIHFRYWRNGEWYYTSANYHVENGHYVCIVDERFNGQSAADVIYEVAQNYRINPQVLLVLLQKEQGLINDKLPNSGQYRSATGYGCPDTDACDSQYYGFKNQLENAAALFRYVLDNGSRYKPVGNNYVQFNPNSDCGGSTIHIENRATSVLYQYTPYQPNQAALNAGYGTGDECSAYGNRNFYLYFSDWFGDPTSSTIPAPPQQYESPIVPDGSYFISSLMDNKKTIDITGNSIVNGANIQLYQKTNLTNTAQQWRFTWDSLEKYYTITNIASGKALDVEGATMSNSTNIQLYDSNKTCAQRWHIKSENNSITILNACNEAYAIDLTGATASNGVNIQLYQSNNTNAQKWQLTPVPDNPIADGVYVVSSALDSSKVLDVQNAATENLSNIQLYTKHGVNNEAQRWNFTYNNEGYYTIINTGSGRALDVEGARMSNGSNIQIYDSNNTCAQHWYIMGNGDLFTVVSACNISYVLDLTGASSNEHTNIQLYQNNNTGAQRWKITSATHNPIADGVYVVSSALDSSKVLDVQNAATENLSNIQLYTKHGVNNEAQRWNFTYNNEGYYTIINTGSGRALDVEGARMSNGSNIQIYDSNNTCAQHWYVLKDPQGYATFYSACNELYVLDLTAAASINHANIQLYLNNGTSAQKWQIIKP